MIILYMHNDGCQLVLTPRIDFLALINKTLHMCFRTHRVVCCKHTMHQNPIRPNTPLPKPQIKPPPNLPPTFAAPLIAKPQPDHHLTHPDPRFNQYPSSASGPRCPKAPCAGTPRSLAQRFSPRQSGSNPKGDKPPPYFFFFLKSPRRQAWINSIHAAALKRLEVLNCPSV